MKFQMSFNMDNAAFEEEPATEVKRLLNQTASRVGQGEEHGNIHDINGNLVGTWEVSK